MGSVLTIAVAIAFGILIFRVGFSLLRSVATPLPEPPPAGELRRVKLTYRCPVCSTEVRMTVATEEEPEPPRHCQGEMDFIAPID